MLPCRLAAREGRGACWIQSETEAAPIRAAGRACSFSGKTGAGAKKRIRERRSIFLQEDPRRRMTPLTIALFCARWFLQQRWGLGDYFRFARNVRPVRNGNHGKSTGYSCRRYQRVGLPTRLGVRWDCCQASVPVWRGAHLLRLWLYVVNGQLLAAVRA